MRAVAEWAAGGPSEPAMLRSPSSCVPKAGCCSRRALEGREGGAGPGRAGGLEQGTMNWELEQGTMNWQRLGRSTRSRRRLGSHFRPPAAPYTLGPRLRKAFFEGAGASV